MQANDQALLFLTNYVGILSSLKEGSIIYFNDIIIYVYIPWIERSWNVYFFNCTFECIYAVIM